MFALRIDGDTYGPYETRNEAIADLSYFAEKRDWARGVRGESMVGSYEIREMKLTRLGEEEKAYQEELNRQRLERLARDSKVPNITKATDLGAVLTQSDTSEPVNNGEEE